MRNTSIRLKTVFCGLIYSFMSLSIILTIYIIDFDLQSALVLGLLCGIAIAIVTYCDTLKRTVVARIMGIVSAIVSQFLLYISAIPYHIILYIYRNDTWVRETGRLSVNEVIGYNWGIIFFWFGLLVSFVISIIIIFLFNKINHHKL